MVDVQIERRGVHAPQVLHAMRQVPRELFVPSERDRADAYADRPLPIGHGQTISQPYIVAVMTELTNVGPGRKVLEIGTGCGYQTAVLCACGAEVFSIEIVSPLARTAAATLAALGYRASLRIGDGFAGWPEAAPFDAIVVTASPAEVPPLLLEQLAEGGRMVIPVGEGLEQDLRVYSRAGDTFTSVSVFPVRFVPMVRG